MSFKAVINSISIFAIGMLLALGVSYIIKPQSVAAYCLCFLIVVGVVVLFRLTDGTSS